MLKKGSVVYRVLVDYISRGGSLDRKRSLELTRSGEGLVSTGLNDHRPSASITISNRVRVTFVKSPCNATRVSSASGIIIYASNFDAVQLIESEFALNRETIAK